MKVYLCEDSYQIALAPAPRRTSSVFLQQWERTDPDWDLIRVHACPRRSLLQQTLVIRSSSAAILRGPEVLARPPLASAMALALLALWLLSAGGSSLPQPLPRVFLSFEELWQNSIQNFYLFFNLSSGETQVGGCSGALAVSGAIGRRLEVMTLVVSGSLAAAQNRLEGENKDN
ncbi:hypothetical protein D4764_22G0004360 [Takifugu flavidus]|uniref:Uncharacterized protein n=1 Tax=Takifugu flavidus TaxID=433684 RepID=A0A5C6NDJ8_9TELE|nr:hypothetical protein D4764_22G0004360 [Takifugu flavidus]